MWSVNAADWVAGLYVPQFTHVTTLAGNGVPQRKQRCTGEPPKGGYPEDIENSSVLRQNMFVGRVLHTHYLDVHCEADE